MILILLIILAVLVWAIQGEAEHSGRQETIQVVAQCSGCDALVAPEWLVCPHCRERLSAACRQCHRSKLLSQKFCPHCGIQATGVHG